MEPRWHDPSTTAEGELLQHVLQLEQIVKMRKNTNCSVCKGDCQCSFKPNRGDEKKPTLKGRGGMESNFDFSKNTNKAPCIGQGSQRLTQDEAMGMGQNDRMGTPHTINPQAKHMATRQSDYTRQDEKGPDHYDTLTGARGSKGKTRTITRTPRPSQGQTSDFSSEGTGDSVLDPKPDWMGNDSKQASADITSQFLASKGVIVKYEQEGDVENGVPTFMDHSGGTPVQARPYQTNGTYPDFNDKAPKATGIHEVAKMPAFAKTGYDEKGSGLHMQLTDGGGRKDGNWNIAPFEERLSELKKGYGNPGLIEEIATLMESVASRL